MGWYEDSIEPEVRDLVKHMRDNGINTECSCGHEMYVQCQYVPDGDIQKLHSLLFCYFAEKKMPINYTIEIHHMVREGHSYTSLTVYLNDNQTEIDRLMKQKRYIERRIQELST